MVGSFRYYLPAIRAADRSFRLTVRDAAKKEKNDPRRGLGPTRALRFSTEGEMDGEGKIENENEKRSSDRIALRDRHR